MEKNVENITNLEFNHTLNVLKSLVADPNQIGLLPKDQKDELLAALGKLTAPNSKKELRKLRRQRRQAQKQQRSNADRKAIEKTGIRQARQESLFVAPEQLIESHQPDMPELSSAKNCYVCKQSFTQLHHFYDDMCGSCAELNYAKRFQKADLTNQVALVTGARVKIGYHIALMLLRSGATVIATTRFPVDAASRFCKEKDFATWNHRLHIHGLDLRHIPSVERFCDYIESKYNRLDILINNAAQTIRRPAEFYKHLMDKEQGLPSALSEQEKLVLENHFHCLDAINGQNKALMLSEASKSNPIGLTHSAELTQTSFKIDASLNAEQLFPKGQLDADLQQVDLRKENSWTLKIGQIDTLEMMEVQLVNVMAPFVLCNRFIPLMKKSKSKQKHIVNVSAMEGQFNRRYKSSNHPHTNMAKAGLNMLTRTSAPELAKEGIYINAVDTGWVTNENPVHIANKMKAVFDFEPPLDIVDGAARVVDPIFQGFNTGKPVYGQFLKDYYSTEW
jgi:NAD(P)-dependent dehydrogenase (short-subunit alcohol dehydrogenase family)